MAGTPPPLTARPALEPGNVLSGRYRLTAAVGDSRGPTLLWRATDDVLARSVAVKILPAYGRSGIAAAPRFLEAAGRASALSHPGMARVYDASLEERPTLRPGRTVDVAYVVSEWVDGRGLAELLATEGPLEPAAAVRAVQDAAEALTAAHARGVAHGRLHPGNVLVTPSGRLRLTDAAVAAAAHRQPVPPPGPDGTAAAEAVAADTRDLAAVLYALLTGRWPVGATDQPPGGVPAAPRTTGGSTSVYGPRQVRAGVPRALDAVVVRALDPSRAPGALPIVTPLALVHALDEVDLRPPEVERAQSTPRARRRLPRWVRSAVPKVLALAFIGLVAVVGYRTGQDVGELPRRPGALDALVQATPAPGSTVSARVDLRRAPVVIRDYDPYSRDRGEQPDAVPNAVDQDLSTAWSTDAYRSAAFGGLKPGVGLLVDLGTPIALSSVQVGMATGGADVDLRATSTLGEDAEDFTVVARVRGAPQVATLRPSSPTPSRYWLIWFTKLPKADAGSFRASVSEIVFTRTS